MIWLLIVLLVCSGALSASETALFALGRRTLHDFGRSTNPLRRRAHHLMRHPRRVLLTVLMANTAVNVAIFAVSFLGFGADTPGEHPALTAVRGVAVLFAVILFGEMIPKALALRSANRFAPPAAAFVYVLQTVLGPIRWVLAVFLVDPVTRLLAPSRRSSDPVTTEELRLLVDHSAQDGHLNATENDMLQAVVGLSDVGVGSVMTPRVDIRYVSIDTDRATAFQTIEQAARRRIPVCGRDLDDISGILHARSLYLNPDAPVRSLVRPAHFVPEQANLMQLLRFFRTSGVRLAIVVDEYGGTSGLVTIEDVVKWIVADLPDHQEIRRIAPSDRIDENTYRMSGDLSVRVWADRFAVSEIDSDIHTLGGLILAKLGRIPQLGDSVRVRNLTLTVDSMNNRRIERVLVQRDTPESSKENDTA